MNAEIMLLTDKVEKLEAYLKEAKKIEKEYEETKKRLLDLMLENNVSSWETLNKTKITIVEGKEATTTQKMIFNEEKFLLENPDMYNKYQELKEVTTKGRKPYLRITIKESDELLES